MLISATRSLRGLVAAVALLCGAGLAQAQSRVSELANLELAGLSVHRETARDIYLAGLLLPPGSQTEDPLLTPAPKAMEYRFATRRLSSRGFSGMLLLQAELGGDQRAPDEVLASLTVLKRHLQGSLMRGDQFVILHTRTNETVFLLNNVELYRVADSGVFEFFFTGWVGRNTAATFRDPLLADEVNESVAKRFEALKPSGQRVATINDWATRDPVGKDAPARLAAATGAGFRARADRVPDAGPAGRSAMSPASIAAAESAAGDPAVTGLPARSPANERQRAPQPEERQLTSIPKPIDSLAGTAPQTAPRPEPVQEVAAALPVEIGLRVDDREYRRQFQDYVSDVMRLVYTEVTYPRRAIKFQWEGKVELSAHLDASGDLIEVVIDNSSGHTGLDRAAAAAVRRAAPFPELGPVAREELSSDNGDGYVMSIPITFALRR